MKYNCLLILLAIPVVLFAGCSRQQIPQDLSVYKPRVADSSVYLEGVRQELSKTWPNNRTVNIVCHGHSVPAGYFATPVVDTFNSYPHLLHRALKQKYPYAVINVITTAIGGENSVSGAARFQRDVLTHNPDVILIDYALNDRAVGLEESLAAWSEMIEAAKENNVKILLLTPTPDVKHVPGDLSELLNLHAEQIRQLAARYHVGLVDSLAAFDSTIDSGTKTKDLLSNGYNHPNGKGHKMVMQAIIKWF